MSKKLLWAMLAILVLAGVLIFAGQSKGQTRPTWFGVDVTTGTTNVLTDGEAPSPGPLSYIQAIESTSWTGSLWGTSPVTGGLIRIMPMYSTGTDTTAGGAPADTTFTWVTGAGFPFSGIGVTEIRTVSGLATFWGE